MELVINFRDVDKMMWRQLQEKAKQHEMSVDNFVLYLVRLGLATIHKAGYLTSLFCHPSTIIWRSPWFRLLFISI